MERYYISAKVVGYDDTIEERFYVKKFTQKGKELSYKGRY